ncbi:hypothetical protein ACWDTG_05245 [Rhodococcus zopfii]|uniref:hypothetical protein n=1 Tax=Rhodococcus zopfii TaxID=43772 RepID=UPI0011114C99|nr:hypothetical protein [Rhodococcus zopfii]
MRVSNIRRAVATFGMVAVAAATIAGCSSDDDSSGDSTTTTAARTTAETTEATGTSTAAAAGESADPATTEAVTSAYVTFFNGATPPAERAALVENGDVFLPTLEGMTANPQAMATTATVEGVTLADPDNADVKWTLLMNGAPVLPDQSGNAVRQDGQWKVSATTFCTLLAIQGGGAPVPGC